MLTFLTSALGLATVGCYLYVAVMFGAASRRAGNNWGRVAVDAATWPVMGWRALEDLYNV
jgi:hypothetical protein